MNINVIGRITQDFELKTSDSGVDYAHFSLVTNKGQGKNRKTYYLKCTVYEALARKLVKARAKAGSHIYVTGGLSTADFRRNNGELGYELLISVHDWSYVSGSSNKESSAREVVNTDSDGGTGDYDHASSDDEPHNNVHHPSNQEGVSPKFVPEIMNLDEDENGLPIPAHHPN